MKENCTQDLGAADLQEIGGGDYVEQGLGLVYGLAFGAGLIVSSPVSGPVLGAAFFAGGILLAYDWFVS